MTEQTVWLHAYCAAMSEAGHGEGKGDRARRNELASEAVEDFRERFPRESYFAINFHKDKSRQSSESPIGSSGASLPKPSPKTKYFPRHETTQFEYRQRNSGCWHEESFPNIDHEDAVRCKICDLWVKRHDHHSTVEWCELALRWTKSHMIECVPDQTDE